MDAPCLCPQVHEPVHQAIGKHSCRPWGQADNRDPREGWERHGHRRDSGRSLPLLWAPTRLPPPLALLCVGRNQPAAPHPVGLQIKCRKQIKCRGAAGKCTAFRPCSVNSGLSFRGGECSGCLVHTGNYC